MIPHEPPVAYFNNEELFLIEGVLTELQTAETTVDLLSQMQQRSQQKNLAIGIAAAVAEMHGVVSTSAMLALYDGEDMHNFAGMLGERVVCGVFAEADKLQTGDTISAVVSERGDVLYVHSLQRIPDNLLLLPLNAVCGQDALFRNCMRVAWNMTKLLWVVIGAIFIGYIAVAAPGKNNYLFYTLFTLLAPPLMMFPMEILTYRAMGPAGDYAETIFRLYGIPRPSDFDAVKGMARFDGHGGFFPAINGAKALEEHKTKFKIKDGERR